MSGGTSIRNRAPWATSVQAALAERTERVRWALSRCVTFLSARSGVAASAALILHKDESARWDSLLR
jgi:hypothetical protein